MSIKQLVPWWTKIAAKVVLSRANINYGRWRRWGLFVHGAMDSPDYAFNVVLSHVRRVGWSDLQGKVVLELGPGDSLATAVIASALGASRIHLVDAGDFATFETSTYVAVQHFLERAGYHPPDLSTCRTRDEMLALCRAAYLTTGLAGLQRLPTASVDLVFSQAVLEHVRIAEFDATLQQLRRVLRPSGVASHQVDLKDHLGGALNNLRFGGATWEAKWMVDSGFYTNRLRYPEILASMTRAGFDVETTAIERWTTLPTPRAKLATHFRNMSDEDLLVKQFDCVGRIAAHSGA